MKSIFQLFYNHLHDAKGTTKLETKIKITTFQTSDVEINVTKRASHNIEAD